MFTIETSDNHLDFRLAWDKLSIRYATEGEGAEGDGSGGEGEGEGSSGTGAGDGSSDGKSGDQVINDPEKKKLSDEAAQWRIKLRETESKLTEASNKLREIEDKDKSELEKSQRDLAEAQKELETLRQTVQDQAMKVAWVESGAASLFKNPMVAFKLLDLTSVEIKDGVADSKAIKALADTLAKSGDVVLANDSGDGDGGAPSGAPTQGKNKLNGSATREVLEKKFPALRNRVS